MNLEGKRVLVTGGTGFIGGRLVEKLVLECGAKVRVLVHNLARCARIARFPVEIIPGNVTDIGIVQRAVENCDVIFHCAYGNAGTEREQRAVTVDGTKVVAQAALATGASRLVHVSSFVVYGRQTPPVDLAECAPRRRSDIVYDDAKVEAEHVLFNTHRNQGLPVTVVQPTIVYGPFSVAWTVAPLAQLKNGRVALVDGGDGLCNAVYVDDLIQAMLLAATRAEAVGEAFLISGEAPVTWREFYATYEKMLGVQRVVPMSVEQIKAQAKRVRRENSTIRQVLRVLREKPDVRSRLLQLPAIAMPYRFLKLLLPASVWGLMRQKVLGGGNSQNPPHASTDTTITMPSEELIPVFTSRTRVCVNKAKERLGYQPQFSLERGMQLTAQWAGWAHLL